MEFDNLLINNKMGDCCSAQVKTCSLTQTIDEITSENLDLALATTYTCIEAARDGLALKFLNIHCLMHKLTRQVRAQREAFERFKPRLSEEEVSKFKETVQRQLLQLESSNAVLKKAFKRLRTGRVSTDKRGVQAYLESVRTPLKEKFECIQLFHRKYYKRLDDGVDLLTNGMGLDTEEIQLIQTVSQESTHPYTYKHDAIAYEVPRWVRKRLSTTRTASTAR